MQRRMPSLNTQTLHVLKAHVQSLD